MATAESYFTEAEHSTFSKLDSEAGRNGNKSAKADTTRTVRGSIGAEEYETMLALVRACGYDGAEAFVSEAVTEKLRALQSKVQGSFGPKKKR